MPGKTGRRLEFDVPPLGRLLPQVDGPTVDRPDMDRDHLSHGQHRASPLVVVASSDAELVDRICERMRHAGFVACRARSAAGCLRVATAVAPDIVLLDGGLSRKLEGMLRSHPASATAHIVRLPVSANDAAHHFAVPSVQTLAALLAF
jgi:hypothetical protein